MSASIRLLFEIDGWMLICVCVCVLVAFEGGCFLLSVFKQRQKKMAADSRKPVTNEQRPAPTMEQKIPPKKKNIQSRSWNNVRNSQQQQQQQQQQPQQQKKRLFCLPAVNEPIRADTIGKWGQNGRLLEADRQGDSEKRQLAIFPPHSPPPPRHHPRRHPRQSRCQPPSNWNDDSDASGDDASYRRGETKFDFAWLPLPSPPRLHPRSFQLPPPDLIRSEFNRMEWDRGSDIINCINSSSVGKKWNQLSLKLSFRY